MAFGLISLRISVGFEIVGNGSRHNKPPDDLSCEDIFLCLRVLRVSGCPFGVLNIESKRGGHLIAFDIEKGLLAPQCSGRGIAVDRPFGDSNVIGENEAFFILE